MSELEKAREDIEHVLMHKNLRTVSSDFLIEMSDSYEKGIKELEEKHAQEIYSVIRKCAESARKYFCKSCKLNSCIGWDCIRRDDFFGNIEKEMKKECGVE